MLLDAFDSVISFINDVGAKMGLSWISVVAFALLLLTIVISFVCTQFSLEIRTTKSVEKINAYLEANPFINEDNLVEFNKLMKKIPATMRIQWQQFMVNRDKKPSEFFTEHNCIEKPFKASGYKTQVSVVRASVICNALLAFIFSCGSISRTGITTAQVLLEASLLSLSILFLGEIYLLFLKTRKNSSLFDLYYNFTNMQKYLDRAVTTLPEYVDYEILFTRKEIVAGIPVLQEYLQQRALFEQDQIKKSKESQVVHEQYDFSALGINGSLVMERAMRECEYFLGNKKRILAEISELEGSQDSLNRSYDEKNKNSQRKLRDIRESLDRLKEKLDSTTNLIVGNDLRKQRENEIQKQRQIEKESDEDNNKYEADKKKLQDEINAKKQEIEELRKDSETSLNGEFKTYADKIYAELKNVATAQVKDEMDSIASVNHSLQAQLEEKDKVLVEKTTLYNETREQNEQFAKQVADQQQRNADVENANASTQNNDGTIEVNAEVASLKKDIEEKNVELQKRDKIIADQKDYIEKISQGKTVEVYRYFDANGDEFYYDDKNGIYYLDENGNRLYVDQNDENSSETEVNTQDNSISQDVAVSDSLNNSNTQQEEQKTEPNASVQNDNGAGLNTEDNNKLNESALEKKSGPVENGKEDAQIDADLSDFEMDLNKPETSATTNNENGEPNATSEIEDIDKQIEEQNQKLNEQNSELSKQLQETKKEADKGTTNKKKKTAGKAGRKPGSKTGKKPASKGVKTTKAKTSSKAKKTSSKSSGTKKKNSGAKRTKKNVDISFDQFGAELGDALKDVDKNGK